MTYTDIWTSLGNPTTETAALYRNLTLQEAGYMNALTLAIAHWPLEYQCSDTVSHIHIKGDDQYECHFQFVLNAYSELHTKEYGE
jgi:hypothetical protein